MASRHGEKTAILAGRKTAARSFLGVPANRFWAGSEFQKRKKHTQEKKLLKKRGQSAGSRGRRRKKTVGIISVPRVWSPRAA